MAKKIICTRLTRFWHREACVTKNTGYLCRICHHFCKLTQGKVLTMSEGTLTVRERDLMYRLMISQMLHDGYHDIASQLSRAVSAVPDCPPSNRLQHVVQLGLRAEPERDAHMTMTVDSVAPGTGIDLEFDTDVQTLAPEAAHYETCYVTSHKAPCRVAAWSNDGAYWTADVASVSVGLEGTLGWAGFKMFLTDGQLVATGSDDASIKILDVERMLAKSATNMNNPESHGNVESHPVIRTLYDHIEDVTALDFHPTLPLLASGSKDFTIKFFDFSKSGVKRAFRSLQEAQEITCLNFHPGGNFLLVGTQHPTLRLYDITTLQCFVSSNPKDQHTGPVTAVTYSPNASIYATASKDGSIKIWDGVSNRCVNTLDKAHSGTDVCSIQFSRNSKYLVSSGKDSLVKLWEVANSRTLITYTGASSEKQQHETRAVFNHSEDYVLFPDEKTTSLCCWDSRNAERNKLLSLGHNNIVRCIVHSPTGPGFMTCSDDFRARFWYYRPSSD